jgi:hypothetical protein
MYQFVEIAAPDGWKKTKKASNKRKRPSLIKPKPAT